jgi:hypothetical protein
MTNEPNLPQDDLLDVIEMANKIEEFIWEVIKGNDRNLAVSALISASINALMGACSNLDEILFLRNMFIDTIDQHIRNIQIKKPDKPS